MKWSADHGHASSDFLVGPSGSLVEAGLVGVEVLTGNFVFTRVDDEAIQSGTLLRAVRVRLPSVFLDAPR